MLWGKEDNGIEMVNLEKMEEVGRELSALGENWHWKKSQDKQRVSKRGAESKETCSRKGLGKNKAEGPEH